MPACDEQTDRRTDGQTHDDSMYRASIASRDKNDFLRFDYQQCWQKSQINISISINALRRLNKRQVSSVVPVSVFSGKGVHTCPNKMQSETANFAPPVLPPGELGET